MTKEKEPIVITAMGAISPFGHGIDTLWSALKQGARCGTPMERVWSELQQSECPETPDNPGEPVWGMRVDSSKLVDLLGKRGLQYWRTGTKFLLGASVLAMQEAGLTSENVDPDGLGITIGSNLVGFQSMVDYDYTAITEGPHYTSPMEAPNTLANAPASHLAIRLKARALNTTVASGQCAGLDALGYAAKMVRDGRARQVVAGGVEELSPAALWVYLNARAISGGTLQKAGLPFAETSTGWLPSEGAAVVVLEQAKDALARGARPLAELAGWSSAFASSPSLEKRAAVLQRTARQALEAAGVSADEIDVVVSGANGLKGQDQAEALALRDLLAHNAHVSIAPVKGILGESYGASGLFQTLAAVCMMKHDLIVAAARKNDFLLTSATNETFTKALPWPENTQGTVLLLAQDLFGSASAIVLRRYND
ncbi:MAG TPA: beta-ketoacyl synthase N-terminal-like domain-containing protein [Ktedonobacteraceae bacterium]|nr:beta-ketoacyl synthase N-terminal-like domain-containing protein [Ktedonobacteraceae bacterium]